MTVKIRGVDRWYTSHRTTSHAPLSSPGDMGADRKEGDLRIHVYGGKTQVWVLHRIPDSTPPQLQWKEGTNAQSHPDSVGLPKHALKVFDDEEPTWVTRSTLTNYRSKKGKVQTGSNGKEKTM